MAGNEPKVRNFSGLLMALVPVTVAGVLFAWWLGTVPAKADPEVGRKVFGNIPSPIVALFYVTVAVFLGLTVYLFALRAQNWERGASDRRTKMLRKRIHQLRNGLSMRTLLEDPGAQRKQVDRESEENGNGDIEESNNRAWDVAEDHTSDLRVGLVGHGAQVPGNQHPYHRHGHKCHQQPAEVPSSRLIPSQSILLERIVRV